MKKLFMMALLISTTCLAAYKDGTYTAKEEQKKGETTWYSELVLTVKDGKISEVKIAEKSSKGVDKNTDKKYNEKWMNVSQIDFPTFVQKFTEELIKTQDADKIDNIAGATGITTRYKKLSKEALKNAQ